jgi:hypothetical protein
MNAPSFQCTYRHVAFVLVSLCVLVVALFAGLAAAIAFIEDGNTVLSTVLWLVGAIIVLIGLTMAAAYAKHRWTLEAAGVRIEEKPKVPPLGLARRRLIPFADIATLRNVESAFDHVLEIATRDGKVYRLMGQGEAATQLQAFAAQIADASARAGHAPPPLSEGLSFWNRPAGLGLIVVMFVFATAFTGAALFALFDGGLEVRARSGEALAIVILLPFGAAYLLYKSLTRRWRVLKQLARANPSAHHEPD